MTLDGVLERHQEQGPPLRVQYSITPYGMTLVPILDTLCAWGRAHLGRQAAAVSTALGAEATIRVRFLPSS